MDYQKYIKYKSKYFHLKQLILQGGNNGAAENNNAMLDKWKNKYPHLFGYIESLSNGSPKELPFMVDPDSVRGKDLIEILEYINKKFPPMDESDYSIGYLYGGTYGQDNERINLLILTLQCLLFVEKIDDQNTHADPGIGTNDPYLNAKPDNIPALNKVLAKYPYTKALCPFGRDCPYWNSKSSFSSFNQPYKYFAVGNSMGMTNKDILEAAHFITNKIDIGTEARAHYHLWGHLPPTAFSIIEMSLEMGGVKNASDVYEIEKFTDVDELYEKPQEYWENLPIKRKCKSQKEREEWGKMVNDKYWRANYPYITELCFQISGMYYWD